MTERQEWDALDVVKPAGANAGQKASESLLCVRVNELRLGKATLPLIATVSAAGLETWLEGKDNVPSVFARFEEEHGVRYREPDGALVKIDSHMCRRLFVTIGLTGGATHLDIARWQGREHFGDIASYDKRSMAERVEAVKDLVMTGRLKGQVAQAYFRLAEDVRDEWLADQVQAMHVTPLGLCVHDFSATPCPKALNCVNDCEHYLFDPKDDGQRTQLVQLQRRTKDVLDRTRPLVEAGQVAPSWVEYHERTLTNVNHILDTADRAPEGMLRPFPNGTNRFAPLLPEE